MVVVCHALITPTTVFNLKSRIRETPTLSTDADSRTDTNLKRSRDLSKKNLKKSKKNEKSRNIYKKRRNKKRKIKQNIYEITQLLQNCIGPTIRIGQESWCLPYAGSLKRFFRAIYSEKPCICVRVPLCLIQSNLTPKSKLIFDKAF